MLERYVIHVTKQCNMDCFYCYEDDKTSTYKLEEILSIADKIAANCKDERFGIEFLGGEPMLNFEAIKEVYKLLEEKYPNRVSDYAITTNGSILPEEAKEFLKNNPKVFFAISIDGTPWANQFRYFKGGQSSWNEVMENLRWCVKNVTFGIHIVTHPFNVANLYSSVCFMYDEGVRNIGVGTIEKTMDIDDRYCNRFVHEMTNVSKSICSGRLSGLYIDLFENVKPTSDVRTYIKDETGKTIAETYGRSEHDIREADTEYDIIPTTSNMSNVIESLRKCVYDNHQYFLSLRNEDNVSNCADD